MDINGRMIQHHSSLRTNDVVSLNVNQLSSGIYFVQIVTNDMITTEKFVKR